MEKEDAQDDGKEATDGPDNVHEDQMLPLFEQNRRAGHNGCGEEDVINGGDHRRVEDVQGFVEVVDLDADTDHQSNEKHPAQRFFPGGLPSEQLFQGNAQAFDASDGERANGRADQDVHQDVPLPVARSSHKDEENRARHHAGGEHDKSWRRKEKIKDVLCLRLCCSGRSLNRTEKK